MDLQRRTLRAGGVQLARVTCAQGLEGQCMCCLGCDGACLPAVLRDVRRLESQRGPPTMCCSPWSAERPGSRINSLHET